MSRVPTPARALRIIQPLEPWYQPARSAEAAPNSTANQSRRVQRRYLFNAHPEAFVGSSEASAFLAEGLSQLLRPEVAPSFQPLMTISQMANVSSHTHVGPVPVLAMAAGEAGELLRLTKMDALGWQWGNHASPTLRLLSIDQLDREETVQWASDGAPIIQIKPALSLIRFEPTRWLLVQKKTSTTLLQPEYHRIPVSERLPGVEKPTDRPSRINPKPILTITSEQTGGFAHSDVSFSYGSQKKPPQLAIIDECGYYSVWDVKGRDMIGSTFKRAKLRHCGHIQLGVQDQLPDEDSQDFRPEHHGILWIGPSAPGVDLWDVRETKDVDIGNDLGALTARSKKIIVWNQSKFEVIDVKDPAFRKSLPILKPHEIDYILDVQPNPVNRSQVIILTTSTVFWIETTSETKTSLKTGGLAVLQSFAHLRNTDADSLRLTVHHSGHGPGNESCIAYVYSDKSTEVDLYWFSVPEKTGLPQFQHFVLQLEIPTQDGNKRPLKIQSLYPTPAYFDEAEARPPTGPGAEYVKNDVGFQQFFVLTQDLGLDQAILAVTDNRELEIVPPDNNREMTKDNGRRAQKRRRRHFLHHFQDTFVVPDGLGDIDELVQQRVHRYRELVQDIQNREDEKLPQRWPRLQNFEIFMSFVAVSINSVIRATEVENPRDPLDVFNAIQAATDNCLETEGGYIPLHTLSEYEGQVFEAPPVTDAAVAAWDSRLQQLFNPLGHRVISQPFISSFLGHSNSAAPLATIREQLESLWSTANIPPRARNSRDVVLAETAEAIARSLFGVAVLDENIPTVEDEPPTWVPTPPNMPAPESNQRLSMSSQRSSIGSQRLSVSPSKTSRQFMSPSKPFNNMSPMKTRFSMSPIKPRLSMSPRKPSSQPYSSQPVSSQPFTSSQPFLSSQPFGSSQTLTSSAPTNSQTAAAASSQDAATSAASALQRLSMLATDIDTSVPGRQHSVLSYWPTKRGVTTENYVSSVLASSNKHMDAIHERRRRVEERRRKRKSQLYGSGAASSQPSGTQDEMDDSVVEALPATQPLPRLAPPIIGSSQASPKRGFSQIMSSQVPQTMSQPMAGRHGMRSPKKGKRKSGF
ncbi:hypothetical protein Cob_v001862 [Colletotrichum orbiculare MAFF 240422]|uniref:Uncharacterized protein n=1 Tax=Colletotrichum orbiculare (strain 104-T / ATCC 96160 / CBS 514.97 / LARS 414 / MAFF 240422) TaxID=1213857 RepID=N4UWM8_COLOR|nr:hypothetical protein Cob_v001862 [Colletotrichum orbiculare MAFF 240422]